MLRNLYSFQKAMKSHWRILNWGVIWLCLPFWKNHCGCHVQTALEGSNIEGMKWIKCQCCGDGEKWDEFERCLNVVVGQGLRIHWMQGDRVESAWGGWSWCHLITLRTLEEKQDSREGSFWICLVRCWRR